MAETIEFIAEQLKRIRRSIRKEQMLARRRLDSLENKLTAIADQIVDTVARRALITDHRLREHAGLSMTTA